MMNSKGWVVAFAAVAGVLIVRDWAREAHAAPQGVDNQGRFVLAVGGSEPNRSDMLWVLHEHPPYSKLKPERGEDAGFMKPQQITLCLYKVEKQGERMKLVAARDIAYDIELQNLNQLEPTARDVFTNLKNGAK